MRYYDLTLTRPGETAPFRRWTSMPNGRSDPNAQNILFDLPVANYAVPLGQQTVTIEGVSLTDLAESTQFAGSTMTLRGGMSGGLPLENPAQAGILVKGYVFQSFGNWVGTDMTLDFVITPPKYTTDLPGNYTLTWRAGQSLQEALQQTFSAAYATYPMPAEFRISDNYINTYDNVHACTTLDGLAAFIHNITSNTPNGPVSLSVQQGTIHATDSTYQPAPVQLSFADMIGQPTWLKPHVMQVKTVLRADLLVNSVLAMPKGYVNAPGSVTTTAQAVPSSVRNKSTFTQDFSVIQARHIGNFRSGDSGDWASIFNCTDNPGG